MSTIERWWVQLSDDLRAEEYVVPLTNSGLLSRSSCFALDSVGELRCRKAVAKNFREADWVLEYIYKQLHSAYPTMRLKNYGSFMGHENQVVSHDAVAIYFEDDDVDWQGFADAVQTLPCADYEYGGPVAKWMTHTCPVFKDAWGWWQYVPFTTGGKNYSYLHNYVCCDYSIELWQIDSPREILDWVSHIAKKNPEVYGETCTSDLCMAFEAIYGHFLKLPDALDAQKVLREYEKKLRGERVPISPRLRHQVLERDGFRCCDCGASPQHDDVTLEVDHRIAVANGGTNDIDNLRTLCRPCNAGKSARMIAYPEDHR